MIYAPDLSIHVISPTLKAIGLFSEEADSIVLGTSFAESLLGDRTHLVQVGGPALGIFQIEPDTHQDIWVNFLAYRPELAGKVRRLCAPEFLQPDGIPEDAALVGCLPYAAAICRLVYRRSPEPLPHHNDPQAQGAYWVRWYNRGGKATAQKYVDAWRRCVWQ